MRTLIILLLFPGALAFGQSITIDVIAPGILAVSCRDAALLDVMQRVARTWDRSVHVTPDALEVLRDEAVTVAASGTPEMLLESLAGTVGLTAIADDRQVHLNVVSQAMEETSRLAVQALDRILATPMDPMVTDALLSASELARERGDGATELGLLQSFIEQARNDPRRASVYLTALARARGLGLIDQARALFTAFEQEEKNSTKESFFAASLLMAEMDRDAGKAANALLRLGVVVTRAPRTSRSRARAILMRAELYVRAGDGASAIDALDRFDALAERTSPKLAARVPFLRGLALNLINDPDSAQAWFVVATMTDGLPDERAEAAIRVAQYHLKRGDEVTALQALRFAESVAASSDLKGEALLELGRLMSERGVDLSAREFASRVRALKGVSSALCQEAVLLEGRLLEAAGLTEQARALYSEQRGDGAWLARLGLLTARCFADSGLWAEGLAALAKVDEKVLDRALKPEVSRIRSRCLVSLEAANELKSDEGGGR